MNEVKLPFSETPLAAWKQKVQAELKGADYHQTLLWHSLEGIDVKPIYTAQDVDNTAYIPTSGPWKIVTHYVPKHDLPYDLLDGLMVEESEINGLQNSLLFVIPSDDLPDFQSQKHHYVHWDLLTDLAVKGNWAGKSQSTAIEHAQKRLSMPGKQFCINTSAYQNAGANAITQLAITLLETAEYVHLLGEKAIDVIWMKNGVGSNFFFESAKIQAMRILWQNFTNVYQKNTPLYILSESTKRNKTIKDKYNNLVRTTYESLAAIMGGSDAVLLGAYDELFASPTAFAHEIAYKQQWVMREESHLAHFQNPLEGAYFTQNIAHQLASKAWDLFKSWESKGGFLSMLHNGTLQKKIKEDANQEQALFDEGKLVLIGANKYPNPMEEDLVLKDLIQQQNQAPHKVLFETISATRLAQKLELDE